MVAEKYTIENIEGRQLFRNTSDHEYQDDSSSNSTRSSNEEGMENAHHYIRDVPLNEPHHEQGIERDCEEASTDSDECSESYDGDIQQYDVTDFDRENIYQDESEYYYYHDEKFEYYEENNSESDEELDEYNHPVQVETNKNVDDDGENEDTNDPIKNDDQGAVGSEENTTSYNHDPSMEKGDSNVSENHTCKDEETKILQARLHPESQVCTVRLLYI